MASFAARLSFAAVAIATTFFAPPVRAGVIAGFDPQRNNRFLDFQTNPTNPTENPNFFFSAFDFSGVGWFFPGINFQSALGVTMIDDRHFVGAAHVAQIAPGATLYFRSAGPNPVTLTRIIAGVQQVPNADNSPSDVLLGTLQVPFTPTDRITSYSIPSSLNTSTYDNQQIYSYDQIGSVGRNNIGGSSILGPGNGFAPYGTGSFTNTGNTRYFLFDDDTGFNDDNFPGYVPPLDRDEIRVVGGDSGSPSFLQVGGTLQLVGAHYALFEGDVGGIPVNISVDSFLPEYRTRILALTVPEPSSLLLLAGTSAALACRCRFRRNAVNGESNTSREP